MNAGLFAAGIALSATAQVAMKYASRFEAWGARWLVFMCSAGACYLASFFVYSALLRKDDLSRISPIMTSAVTLAAVIAGIFLFGEKFDLRKGAGIALGIAAIALLSR